MRLGAVVGGALALLVVAVWVLWPATEQGGNRQESVGVGIDRVERATDDASQGSATVKSTLQRGDAPQRESAANGHRVRVLDEGGQAMVGAELHFDALDAERGSVRSGASAAVRWPSLTTTTYVTDEDGLTMIPQLGSGVAYFSEFGLAGSIACPEIRGDEPASAVLTLQLRAVPMVELVVHDTDGERADQGFEFSVRTALQDEIAQLPANANLRARNLVWHEDDTIGVLPDGRRVLVLEAGRLARQALPDEHGAITQELTFAPGAAEPEVRVVDANEVGPLVFQMPSLGSVALKIEGGPQGLVPSLAVIRESGETLTAQTRTDGFPVNGWWQFEGIPIGRSVRVAYGFAQPNNRMSTEVTSRLFGPELPMLQQQGEHLQHVMQFQWSPGFVGKLVLPEGFANDTSLVNDLGMSHRPRATLLFGDGNDARVYTTCHVLPDNTVHVEVRDSVADGRKLSDLRGFNVLWASNAWAFVDTTYPSLGAVVNVGDIPVQTTRPLLKVRAVDEQGRPVAGAHVRLEYLAERSQEVLGHSDFQDGWSDELATNEVGEAWVVARDWYDYFGILPTTATSSELGRIVKVRTIVSHEHTSRVVREVPLNAREIEVRLGAAGTLVGSIRAHPVTWSCLVAVVEPGGTLDDALTAEMPFLSVNFRGRSLGEPVDFEMKSLPAGAYDVVLSCSGYGERKQLRIAGVNIRAGETNEDRRLQDVDLTSLLECQVLTLFDAQGRELSEKQLNDGEFRTVMPMAHGVSRSPAKIADNRVYVLLPKELMEGSPAVLQSSQYASIALEPLQKGERDLVLTELKTSRVELTNAGDLPVGASLRVEFIPEESYHRNGRVRVRSLGKEGIEVRWGGPGSYSLRWNVRGFEGKWRSEMTQSFELSESEFESAATVEIAMPAELIAQFPDSP